MKASLLILLLVAATVGGCRRGPTLAERERELLPVALLYFHDHQLPGFDAKPQEAIYLGTPTLRDPTTAEGRSLLQLIYDDPSPEWLAAYASSSLPVLPASHAEFTNEHPWFRKPGTQETVVIFAVHQITFTDEHHATVLTSAAFAPSAGGETFYHCARERGVWKVTREAHGAVY